MTTQKWFVTYGQNVGARLRLFCFPYAGSGALVFRDWPGFFPKEVQLWAVQLPGRETRIRETLYNQVEPLVAVLMEAIYPVLDMPFAFYGHSMGALVAFVLARELRKEHHRLPLHLLVSGRSAPHAPKRANPFHLLSQDAFIEELRQLGGTEDNVLENAELMDLLMPLLRADFQVNEAYQYVQEPPLDCPISAFRGSKDDLMTYEDVAAWREQTTRTFRLRTLPGGHFFINSAPTTFKQILAYDLRQILTDLQWRSC